MALASLPGTGRRLDSGVSAEGLWQKCVHEGRRAHRQAHYAEAEKHFNAALQEAESFGPLDPRLPVSLNDLGEFNQAQGKLTEAEKLLRTALAIRQQVLGPEHPTVAESLNNFAALRAAQGNYAEAEPLYRWALEVEEKALGQADPSVAATLNNLALLCKALGRYGDAELAFRRALVIWQQCLGPEHAHVATSLNNLAALYYTQGKPTEAEPFYHQALAIKEKALGPQHPEVATILNNLGELYRGQGKLAKRKHSTCRFSPSMRKPWGRSIPTWHQTFIIWLCFTTPGGAMPGRSRYTDVPWPFGRKALLHTTRTWLPSSGIWGNCTVTRALTPRQNCSTGELWPWTRSCWGLIIRKWRLT